MPILDIAQQARLQNIGCIRIGDTIEGTTQKGTKYRRPCKIDTFRITSPQKEIVEQAAQLFGGTVDTFPGPKGHPEWEVTTDRKELPVMVPPQEIDPNYELYQGRARSRFCNGLEEKIRSHPCLCRRWDNHSHDYYQGVCKLCGIPQNWKGEPHEHDFANEGLCSVCGASRLCKPTTRVSLMIPGIRNIGVFKLESHGYNFAVEMPAIAPILRQINKPVSATLGMRFESRPRIVAANGREKIEVRDFTVPTLTFRWMDPTMMYSDGPSIEGFGSAGIEAPVFRPLAAGEPAATTPAIPSRDDVVGWISEAETMKDLEELWGVANEAKVVDPDLRARFTHRKAQLERDIQVVDAVIVD